VRTKGESHYLFREKVGKRGTAKGERGWLSFFSTLPHKRMEERRSRSVLPTAPGGKREKAQKKKKQSRFLCQDAHGKGNGGKRGGGDSSRVTSLRKRKKRRRGGGLYRRLTRDRDWKEKGKRGKERKKGGRRKKLLRVHFLRIEAGEKDRGRARGNTPSLSLVS